MKVKKILYTITILFIALLSIATAADDKQVVFINTNVVNSAGNTVAVNGGFYNFAKSIEEWGFKINHGFHSGLINGELDGIDIYILAATKMFLHDDDKAALRQWIQGGGRLLVINLHGGWFQDQDLQNLGSFLNTYGITYGTNGTGSLTMFPIPGTILAQPNAISQGVYSPLGRQFLNVDTTKAVVALQTDDGKAFCAYSINRSALGKGKVVVFGDAYVPISHQGEGSQHFLKKDNKDFFENIFEYFRANTDLRLRKVKVKSRNIVPGDKIKVIVKIQNKGDIDVADVEYDVYLTDDGTLSTPAATIKKLGSFSVDSIAAGKKTKEKIQVELPSFIAPGSYKLVVEVDPKQKISDKDRNNNTKAGKSFLVN